MALISILTACYNEEDNVSELYSRVKQIFSTLPEHEYEHIFIDNASSDKTVAILKEIAQHDKNVKIIVNSRNFGHIRSPFFGLTQATGDAVISLVADLQDPPELIPEFIQKWEKGHKIVVGIKHTTTEHRVMAWVRRFYYTLISKIASGKQIKNFTGFGLYDKKVIQILAAFEDPYPYFRGMIAEIGFDAAEISYHQPARKKGFTKNNLFTLYDMAMLGITSYSKAPIRLATMFGFLSASLSFVMAIVFLLLKLILWHRFSLGISPLLVGFFFFTGVQLFFVGLIGEYVSSIHTYVQKRPLVVVKEKINFNGTE